MAQDKQLRAIKLSDVIQKRRWDQALNAKEFAVLAGISYSTAREWFRLPGFPVLQGVVFWADFVQWRRFQTGLCKSEDEIATGVRNHDKKPISQAKMPFPPRAAKILAEAD